jgi:hypothetical protein
VDAVSASWFVIQIGACVLAFIWGRRIARKSETAWKSTAVAATLAMVAWPLLRFHPAPVLDLPGAPILIFI